MQVAWLWTPGSLDRSRGNRLIFSAPGDYEIGLSFRTAAVPPQWAPEGYAPEPALISKWEDMVWTDAATLKLRVELPEAQADRAAMEDFLAMEHLWMLYATPADVRRMLQEELIEFREKHGGSRYFKLTEIYRISAHLERAYLAQDKQRHEALLNELETLRLNGSGAGLPPGWKSIADDLAATAKRQGQNMEALKSNFLFKRYFKKLEREEKKNTESKDN